MLCNVSTSIFHALQLIFISKSRSQMVAITECERIARIEMLQEKGNRTGNLDNLASLSVF